ncbi:MAG: lysylphosphatidylglycerol synthase transmembrane domain-containing protein [Thermomicrobiales bacterium]
MQALKRRFLTGVLLGVAVISVVVVFSDREALLDAASSFDRRLLPLILGLTLMNYLLRFLKWQYYLDRVNVHDLDTRTSGLIFASGFSMAMTPGKVGEFLKSLLIRTRTGTPMTRTLPVVFAERLTDGLSMVILSTVGLLAFRVGWPLFILMSAVLAAILIFIQRESLVESLLGRLGDTRFLQGRIDEVRELYRSTRTLLRPRPLAAMAALSSISWFFECLVLYVILIGLGFDHSWNLLLASTFVFATSAWLGGASLLPGGLGATEASAAALLVVTVDDPAMTGTVAAAATLILRFATLWFGVAVGLAALAVTARWLGDGVAIDQAIDEDPASAGLT